MRRPCLSCGRAIIASRKRRCDSCTKNRQPQACIGCGATTTLYSRGRCATCDAYADPTWRAVHNEHRSIWLDWQCAICGAVDNLQLDHVDGNAHNQTADGSNYQTLCRSCNSSKRGIKSNPQTHLQPPQQPTHDDGRCPQQDCGLSFKRDDEV